MKYLTLIILLAFQIPSSAVTFIGEVVESSSNYSAKPVHTYLVKVKQVFLGEYEWQYKTINIHHILSTSLIENKRELLVESVDGNDSILAVFENDKVNASNSEALRDVMGIALANRINEQNSKHHFLHHGRLKALVKSTSQLPKTLYTRVYMEPTGVIVFDYYLKSLIHQWRKYIPSGTDIAFRVDVKEGKVSVTADENFGGYYPLAVAISRYEK